MYIGDYLCTSTVKSYLCDRWDSFTSVEEVMRGLQALVTAGKVLYLGVSDHPAWVVMKANAYARQHGLTPFSLYQGKWSAAFRDMEAEIIPMCRDQGMAIVPWEPLGGGKLLSKEQREKKKDGRQSGDPTKEHLQVSNKLEDIASEKSTTVQAVVSTAAAVQRLADMIRLLHTSFISRLMSSLSSARERSSTSRHSMIT
jgi:aryl-alcohol dehydrogenase-like predicted oxidoreductase